MIMFNFVTKYHNSNINVMIYVKIIKILK